MAFPDGWTKRLTVTALPTVVGAGGVTDFTALVSAASLYPLLASLREDGGDLVCTLNADGSGRLALDVLPGWSSSGGTGFVRVGPLSLSSVTLNTLYFWGGNASATQPAAGAAHGQHAAYDALWGAYYPLDGDGNDRTANGYHLSALSGTPIFGPQKVGGGVHLAVGDILQVDEPIFSGDHPLTVIAWIKHDSTGVHEYPWAFRQGINNKFLMRRHSDDTWRTMLYSTSTVYTNKSSPIASTNWHHVVGSWSEGTISTEVDASGSPSTAADSDPVTVTAFRLGSTSTACSLDDVQVHLAVRSAAWIATEYRQTSAPGTFWQAGTLDTIGGSSGGARRRRLIICGRA